MLLQDNKFTAETPYFQSFTGYTIPLNTEIVDDVGGMISYNYIINEEPVVVNYFVGAKSTYKLTFVLKNITENAQLNVEFVFDGSVFMATTKNIDISPTETKTVDIGINKDAFNLVKTKKHINTTLTVRVTNKESSEIIIRDINVAKVQKEVIDSNVDIL